MNLKESNKHIRLTMLISLLLVCFCTFNILYIMFTKQHLYSGINLIEYNENKNANSGVNILRGIRGTIYDRDGEAIAQDVVRYTLFAYLDESRVVKYTNTEGKDITEYRYVRDFEKTAEVLSKYIDMTPEEIKQILDNAKNAGLVQTEFGLAGKNLARSVKDQIVEEDLEGIGFLDSVERNYPTGVFASHLIGFATYDEQVLLEEKSTLQSNAENILKYYDSRINNITMKIIDLIDDDRISLDDALKENLKDQNDVVKTVSQKIIDIVDLDQYESRIKGKMGLEYTLDSILKGKNGLEVYTKDKKGYAIPNTTMVQKYAQDGNDVYLTLDRNVQLALQSALEQTSEETKAYRAWGIVMEVETGKILGWANSPSFDMNVRDLQEYLNTPSEYLYEPGSVIKAMTYAAAIDSDTYPYKEKFDSGIFYFGTNKDGDIYRSNTPVEGYNPIRDALNKDYGSITFDKGFIVSSNIAICELITKYMDYDIYREYLIDRFHFTKPVDIPYIYNLSGYMRSTYASEKLNTGFGQGISINALQMCQAYTAILNDGKMVRPYVVDRIVSGESKEVIEQYTTEIVGQPISEETADYVCELMRQVVEDEQGTGHYRYQMEDVDIIAKTGTGQIANSKGQYGDIYTMSVMAAAPAQDPKVMVYYVFEGHDYLNYSGEPFKETMKAALVACNISSQNEQISEEK